MVVEGSGKDGDDDDDGGGGGWSDAQAPCGREAGVLDGSRILHAICAIRRLLRILRNIYMDSVGNRVQNGFTMEDNTCRLSGQEVVYKLLPYTEYLLYVCI